MPGFEDELKRLEPVVRLACGAALLGKKIIVRGAENFIRDGPNIIVGNHCGSFKDVATVFRVVPRPVFFTANKQIFTRDEFDALVLKHLRRHLKAFGSILDTALSPLKYLFVAYISRNIARIGTIPVDLYHQGKREAIERCQDYLKMGRAIIALQGRGRVMPRDPNPYVRAFGRGIAIIACNMKARQEMDIPVTPIAMVGTQLPFLIPGKVLVNVGTPLTVAGSYDGNFEASVDRFKEALEKAVNGLFFELIRT